VPSIAPMQSCHDNNRQRVKLMCIAEFKMSVQMRILAHLEVRVPSLVVSYLAWNVT
jgi:hypothetical protein